MILKFKGMRREKSCDFSLLVEKSVVITDDFISFSQELLWLIELIINKSVLVFACERLRFSGIILGVNDNGLFLKD